MPPLNQPNSADQPSSLSEQMQAAIAPLQQAMEENSRNMAQIMQVLQNMQAGAQQADQAQKQLASSSAAQVAAVNKIGNDIQVAVTTLLLKMEQSGRLG